MKNEDAELDARVIARNVLQKPIDKHLALRRREMLLADSFYRERKTQRLTGRNTRS